MKLLKSQQIQNGLSKFLKPVYEYNKNILDSNIQETLLVGTNYRKSLTYLFQDLKMPDILTENPTNLETMANELPVKLQLLKKYTEIFNDQPLYFSSNIPIERGDFNIGMQGHDKFTMILHEIKCRRSEFAPSNHSILNKVERYNIESIDHTKLELPSQIKKLCYDFSHLKNEEFEKACLDLENHKRLKKLIKDDVLLIYKDSMEFDEMVDLLIRCELDPNIQPLLDHHLTLLS